MPQRFGYALSVLLCAVLIGIPLPFRAETLDDASIRKFYADSIAVLRDPPKLQTLMQQRLDEGFTLQLNSSQSLNGGTPQTNATNSNKAQTIADAVQGATAMNIATIDDEVTSIKYSDDHKFAFVTDSTTSTGTMKVPTADGPISVNYAEAESCVDRVGLEGGLIMMMQSACNDRLAITK